MSSADGKSTSCTPSCFSSFKSFSRVRGYLEKSSFGPNWVGLTNTLTATTSHCFRASRTSDKCPACSPCDTHAQPHSKKTTGQVLSQRVMRHSSRCGALFLRWDNSWVHVPPWSALNRHVCLLGALDGRVETRAHPQ